MPKYVVKTPLRHDGKDYQPGDVLDLGKKDAEAMPWAVEPVKLEKEEPRSKK